MKLLLKAAVLNRKHFSLLAATFITLIALTIASQFEMFALGVLANKGADFFTLFSPDKGDVVSLTDVQGKWNAIDLDLTGKITKESARHYLSGSKDLNPLDWLIREFGAHFKFANNILAVICVLIGVAVFKAIWLFASRYTTQLLAIRVSRDLRLQYFRHIQSLPMSFYQKHNIGSLSSRVVGDAGQIASSINSCLTNYLQSPFTILTSLMVCFFLSWQLSLVIFVGTPMIIFPIILLSKRVKRVTKQLQSNQEKFASVLIDFLAGIQTVKIFAMEAFSFRKYKEQNDRMAVLEGKTAKYGLLTRPILHAITTMCIAAVVLFGLYGLEMPISQLIVFCAMLQLAYEPVKKFADENGNIQKGIVAAERMFEVLHLKPDIEDKEGAVELKELKELIEFDHVWFRYGEEWVLKNLSFTVAKGQTVAIVGPTGSGKSTIVQLIPRLYDVQKGQIRIDHQPLDTYTQKSLREQIAFVSQKPFLFYDTIAANIAYGRNFSLEAIEEASKRANADEFIDELPDRYDSHLAEGGQNFSGGQQQRLALARAFIKDTSILILDEATSALDALSEKKIRTAIEDQSKEKDQKTRIIIAHRLSTIEHADKIIYLHKGEKIAEGTKDELLATCPPFRLTWEALYSTESYTPQTT